MSEFAKNRRTEPWFDVYEIQRPPKIEETRRAIETYCGGDEVRIAGHSFISGDDELKYAAELSVFSQIALL